MADPVVTLDAARVFVDPGGQARINLTVTNTGTIVEGFALDVLGEAAGWAEVTPAEVSVYPQQTESAVIIFSPPGGSAVPGGVTAFGVRARSVVDPESSAVAEGDVEVGTVLGLQAEITPATSKGRWRGRHRVEFSNSGNVPATLQVSASDKDEALGFLVRPDLVDVPLGGSARVRVIARTRKPFLRGSPVELPFQVVGERLLGDEEEPAPPGQTQPNADPGRPVAEATLHQKPILSRTVVIVAGLALAAIIAGGVYAWTREPPPETFQQLGPPPTPKLTAKAVDHDSVRLTWQQIEQIQTYRLLTVDPQTEDAIASTPVPADQTGQDVHELAPGSENCFKLHAVRGNLQSPGSNVACATTRSAPASATPSAPQSPAAPSPTSGQSSAPPSNGSAPPANGSPPPSGMSSSAPAPPGSGTTGSAPASSPTSTAETVAEGQWISLATAIPHPPVTERLDRVVDQLARADLQAKMLDSTAYPELAVIPGNRMNASTVVYVGPFDSEADAQQTCRLVEEAMRFEEPCFAVQPDPPQ